MINFLKGLTKAQQIGQRRPLTQSFLGSERTVVRQILSTLFGYHLLVLGEAEFLAIAETSPIHHRVWIPTGKESIAQFQDVVKARVDKLPLLSESIDVVYLAHILGRVQDPQEVLRETFRVLISEGRALISGINPWSVQGVWRSVLRVIKRSAGNERCISVARLRGWLNDLGFESISWDLHSIFPSRMQGTFWQRLLGRKKLGATLWTWWGGEYVFVAVKRVVPLTWVGPVVSQRFPEVGSVSVESSDGF